MGLKEKVMNIQSELKAPKGQYNSFGKYKYRSCEDILEAVKPLLKKNKCILTLCDSIEMVGERVYVKATAKIVDNESDEELINTAFAREESEKKGQDGSQITGTASSYARKYALNGLFLIDDTKDADTDESHNERAARKEKAENEEKFEKVGKELVTKDDVNALMERCKNDGVDTAKLCSLYKVKELAMLTVNQLSNIINNWNKVKESAAS